MAIRKEERIALAIAVRQWVGTTGAVQPFLSFEVHGTPLAPYIFAGKTLSWFGVLKTDFVVTCLPRSLLARHAPITT